MCKKWLSFFAHGFLPPAIFPKSGQRTVKFMESSMDGPAIYLNYPKQDNIGVVEELSKRVQREEKGKWKKDFQRKAL